MRKENKKEIPWYKHINYQEQQGKRNQKGREIKKDHQKNGFCVHINRNNPVNSK